MNLSPSVLTETQNTLFKESPQQRQVCSAQRHLRRRQKTPSLFPRSSNKTACQDPHVFIATEAGRRFCGFDSVKSPSQRASHFNSGLCLCWAVTAAVAGHSCVTGPQGSPVSTSDQAGQRGTRSLSPGMSRPSCGGVVSFACAATVRRWN